MPNESREKIEKAHETIDRFQDLIDLQDKKLDLKCELQGHDYGQVLIAEMENAQREIYKRQNFFTDDESSFNRDMQMLADFMTIWEDVIGDEQLRVFTRDANSQLAAQFLSIEQLQLLEARAKEKYVAVIKDKPIGLGDEWKSALTKPCESLGETYFGFTADEIKQYEPYLTAVTEPSTAPPSETERAYILKWKEVFKRDPNLVVAVFRFVQHPLNKQYNTSSFGGDKNIALNTLLEAFHVWEPEYKNDPYFVRGILTARIYRFEKERLYDPVFVRNKEKILSYKEYFLRILNSLGEFPVSFLLNDFFGSNGIYDKYFLKDPEGVTEMIEVCDDNFHASIMFKSILPLFEKEFQQEGASEKIMAYWRAFAKVLRGFQTDSRNTYEIINILREKIWPDIQANPALIEELGWFIADMGNAELNAAYVVAREDILAKPADFIRFMKDSLNDNYNMYKFQKDVAMVWPYFRDQFRQGGYSENMKHMWGFVKQLPISDTQVFGLLADGFKKYPQQAIQMLDDARDTGRSPDDFINNVFPVAQEDFSKFGYTPKIKQYIAEMKNLYAVSDNGYIRDIVLRDFNSSVYHLGSHPAHQQQLEFFRDYVMPKLNRDREEYTTKLVVYFKDPRIEGLRDLIINTSSNLPDAIDKFEEDFGKMHPWFREKFMYERGNIAEMAIDVGDFPLDRDRMTILTERINAKTEENIGEYDSRLFTINRYHFDAIYYSFAFQDVLKDYVGRHSGEMTYMNSFSICHAVFRLLDKNKLPLIEPNIADATKKILEYREKVGQREIFGPNTKLIIFAHEEWRFDNEKLIDSLHKRAGGKDSDILCNAKGVKMTDGKNQEKEKVLNSIRNAKQGSVTLVFNGHGSSENWAFTANRQDNLNHSIYSDPGTINYRELGDALYESGNIRDFNLVALTCLSYNYMQNLFEYLENVKKTKEKPYISFASGNRNRSSYSQLVGDVDDRFASHIRDVAVPGKSITAKDLWKAESFVWEWEDPATFIQGDNDEGVEIGATEGLFEKYKKAA